MCDNPLSPELKDALEIDSDRLLGFRSRLLVDRVRPALELPEPAGGGFTPLLRLGTPTSSVPHQIHQLTNPGGTRDGQLA